MKNNGFIKKKITDINHPVFGNFGLFSTKLWKKNDILGEYYGELCEYRNGDYIAGIDIDGFRGICIDSENSDCLMKYINHYQNIAIVPNCKYLSILVENKPKIFLIVTNNINIGDEILADYKFSI